MRGNTRPAPFGPAWEGKSRPPLRPPAAGRLGMTGAGVASGGFLEFEFGGEAEGVGDARRRSVEMSLVLRFMMAMTRVSGTVGQGKKARWEAAGLRRPSPPSHSDPR